MDHSAFMSLTTVQLWELAKRHGVRAKLGDSRETLQHKLYPLCVRQAPQGGGDASYHREGEGGYSGGHARGGGAADGSLTETDLHAFPTADLQRLCNARGMGMPNGLPREHYLRALLEVYAPQQARGRGRPAPPSSAASAPPDTPGAMRPADLVRLNDIDLGRLCAANRIPLGPSHGRRAMLDALMRVYGGGGAPHDRRSAEFARAQQASNALAHARQGRGAAPPVAQNRLHQTPRRDMQPAAITTLSGSMHGYQHDHATDAEAFAEYNPSLFLHAGDEEGAIVGDERFLYRLEAPPPTNTERGAPGVALQMHNGTFTATNPMLAASGGSRGADAKRAAMAARGGPVPQSDGWIAPSEHEAMRYVDVHHPRMRLSKAHRPEKFPLWRTPTGRHCSQSCGGCDPWHEKTASAFIEYGAALTNYFKLLKWLCWVYGIMSLIALPALVFNTFGPTQESAVAELGFQSTTIGNLGDNVNVTAIALPGTRCGDGPCTVNKNQLAQLYAGADFLGIFIFLVAVVWLRYFERQEGRVVDRRLITIDKYSILVEWVPPNSTEAEMAQHLERVTSHKVARVVYAEDNAHLIRLYIKRGKLVKALEEVEQEIGYFKSIGRDTTKVERKKRQLEQKINEITRLRNKQPRGENAVMAFVTFESEDGRLDALRLYPRGWGAFLCQSNFKRFRGHRLKIDQAPKPSTVLWENLSTTWTQRRCREVLSTLVASALIIISFLFLLWASWRQEVARETGGQAPCVDGVVYNSTTDSETLHCYCKLLDVQDAAKNSLCQTWLAERALALALMSFSSVALVGVNFMLNIIMKKLARFEAHHSITNLEVSFSTRLFYVLFINTAISTCTLLLLLRRDTQILTPSPP